MSVASFAYTTRMLRQTGWLIMVVAALACARTKGPHAARHAETENPQVAAANASSAPVTPAARPLSFEQVKELDCDDAHLYPLSGKTFISCMQKLLYLDGDQILEDTSIQKGVGHDKIPWGIASIVGQWPNSVWLGTMMAAGAGGQSGEFFRFADERWKKVGKAHSDVLMAMLPWTEQRAVAILEPPYIHGDRLVPVGAEPFMVPRFTRPLVPSDRCVTRMAVEATTVLEPGNVMVAGGQTCDFADGRGTVVYTGIGAEVLQADQPQGKFMQLEGVPKIPLSSVWTVTALLALSPTDVLLAANSVINQDRTMGYFARWQGERFAEQPPPFDGIVNLVWLETPDDLWATDVKHNLWRKQAGKWRLVPWGKPQGDDTEITQGWARGPHDIWLVTRSQSRKSSAIYHGR